MKRKIRPLPDLASMIKELTANSPHTLKEVLDYAGIPAQYISKWQNSTGNPRRGPYYDELAKVAEMLDKPIEVFIYTDRDPYVHIPEDKFKIMVDELKSHLSTIEESTKKIVDSELVNPEEFTA